MPGASRTRPEASGVPERAFPPPRYARSVIDRSHAGRLVRGAFLTALVGAPATAIAQDPAVPTVDTLRRPTMQVARLTGERPRIDGRIDDPAWAEAAVATDFFQREPNPGAPATERTEVRVLIDRSALYVAYRCWVEDPSTLVARLARRDDSVVSDRVWVDVGSTGDGRTAFSFALTAAGTQQDILIFDDFQEDPTWDAVWEGATARFEGGYTAEFRIPFSQLRYPTSGPGADTWNIQFQRDIPANGEVSFWAPILPDYSGYVSHFGRLEGMSGLRAPRRIELVPYLAGRVTRAPGDENDPFYDATEARPAAGADARVGLTAGITLSATINPDFGQVEADPAVVNLSAFETFFEERRPFFVEGTDVFAFGGTRTNSVSNRPTFLYTRRIGRPPLAFGRVHPGLTADFVDSPEETTIGGAAKVSGQLGAWSVGLLDALTTSESAAYYDTLGVLQHAQVEPLTNYLASRVRRGWSDGLTVAGAFLSAVHRDMEPEFESLIPSRAYVGGLDFEHALPGRSWTLSGVASYSRVEGAAAAGLQLAPQRYYQRPDQSYLEVDPSATSLSGYRAELSVARTRGTHWRGSFTTGITSPGFDVNDLGFQSRADWIGTDWLVSYIQPQPGRLFRRWNAFAFGGTAWNYGGDVVNNFYNLDASFTHPNLWTSHTRLSYRPLYINDRLTRGGPVALRPSDTSLLIAATTDRRRRVSANAAVNMRTEFANGHDEAVEWDMVLDGFVALRLGGSLELQLIPFWGRQLDTDQFVLSRADPAAPTFGTRYVFADLRQDDFYLGLRADWTLRPDLSLQLYLSPGVTSARFRGFKEFEAARMYDFTQYGEERGTITPTVDDAGAIDGYDVDPGDGGTPFHVFNPDFSYLNLRGNAVLRWEYRPGSTLFVVWQQTRDEFAAFDGFDVGSDYGDVFSAPVHNVFLVKATYWLGL